jgi:hypothetical protein
MSSHRPARQIARHALDRRRHRLRCRQASSQHPAGNRRYRADWQGELFLCRPGAMRLRPALAAQGWSTWLIGEPVFATSGR